MIFKWLVSLKCMKESQKGEDILIQYVFIELFYFVIRYYFSVWKLLSDDYKLIVRAEFKLEVWNLLYCDLNAMATLYIPFYILYVQYTLVSDNSNLGGALNDPLLLVSGTRAEKGSKSMLLCFLCFLLMSNT